MKIMNNDFIVYAVAVVIFFNYFRTLSPTIAGGDAGSIKELFNTNRYITSYSIK
jgi:hypothetical protein